MYEEDNSPIAWDYKPPDKCGKEKVKLFAPQKPYYGPRINSAILAMPIRYPDFKKVRGLAEIAKPIPREWSWRKIGTNRIEKGGIRDQGKCGGCWAFSLASCLGDRYALKYNIAAPYLSAAWVISNAKPPNIPSNLECQTGGNTYTGSKWLERYGAKLEICWPYSIIRDHNYVSPNNLSNLPENCCYNCCSDKVTSGFIFKVQENSTKYIADLLATDSVNQVDNEIINVESTIRAIQLEIMNNGPVVTSFNVYSDFMDYWMKDAASGKVYIRNSDEPNGGHAVVITGWGEQEGIKYWEIRNSWGLTGDKGYCKIAMSISTPKDKWVQVDIPYYNGQIWYGGVVSFLPGELKNKEFFNKGISYEEEQKMKKQELQDKKLQALEKIKIDKDLKSLTKLSAASNTNNEQPFTKSILFYVIIGLVVLLILIVIIKLLSSRKTNADIPVYSGEPSKYYYDFSIRPF